METYDEIELADLKKTIDEIKQEIEKPKPQHPYLVPPKFSGRDDPKDWEHFLKDFCRVGDALGWDETTLAKTLPSYLTGEAGAIYDLLTDAEKSSWAEIKKAMGAKLSQDHQGHNVARAQLLLRDQKSGESVSEFAAAIESLVKKGFPKEKGYNDANRNDLLLDAFLRGLKFNLKKVLMRQDRPANLAEAINAAQKEELNQKILNDEENRASAKGRQEAIEKEQFRLSRELEKLKMQVKEEKVNVVAVNSSNENPRPMPLANVQFPNPPPIAIPPNLHNFQPPLLPNFPTPPIPNFPPHQMANPNFPPQQMANPNFPPHQMANFTTPPPNIWFANSLPPWIRGNVPPQFPYFAQFRNFPRMRGNFRRPNSKGGNGNDQNDNTGNPQNGENGQNDNPQRNFNNRGNFRGNYRGNQYRGRGQIMAILPYLVLFFGLSLLAAPGMATECKKYVLVGVGTKCLKNVMECGELKTQRISPIECLDVANPQLHHIHEDFFDPKPLTHNLEAINPKCPGDYYSLELKTGTVFSDGIGVSGKIFDGKSCPISYTQNYCYIGNEFYIWYDFDPAMDKGIMKEILFEGRESPWKMKLFGESEKGYWQLVENPECGENKTVQNDTSFYEKIVDWTDALKTKANWLVEKTSEKAALIENPLSGITDDIKNISKEIWWWIKFSFFYVILPLLGIYICVMGCVLYQKARVFWRGLSIPWRLLGINVVEVDPNMEEADPEIKVILATKGISIGQRKDLIELKNFKMTPKPSAPNLSPEPSINAIKTINLPKQVPAQSQSIQYLNYCYSSTQGIVDLPLIKMPFGNKEYYAILDTWSSVSFGPIHMFSDLPIENIEPIAANVLGGKTVTFTKVATAYIIPKGMEFIECHYLISENPYTPFIVGKDQIQSLNDVGIKTILGKEGVRFDYQEFDWRHARYFYAFTIGVEILEPGKSKMVELNIEESEKMDREKAYKFSKDSLKWLNARVKAIKGQTRKIKVMVTNESTVQITLPPGVKVMRGEVLGEYERYSSIINLDTKPNFSEEENNETLDWFNRELAERYEIIPDLRSNKNFTPAIETLLCEIKTKTMFDTGAQFSMLKKSHSNYIRATKLFYPTPPPIYAAGLIKVAIVGKVAANVKCANFSRRVEIWIVEDGSMPYDFIMGYDIIKQIIETAEIIIDEGALRIGDEAIPYLPDAEMDGQHIMMVSESINTILPVILIKLNGKDTKALFDSGASVSYMRESLKEKLNLPAKKNALLPQARTANQSVFNFIFQCTVWIQIGNFSTNFAFLVTKDSDCPYPCLIGSDLIIKMNEYGNKVGLEFHRNKIVIGEKDVPLINYVSINSISPLVEFGESSSQKQSEITPKINIICVRNPEKIVLEPQTDNIIIGEVFNHDPNKVYITESAPLEDGEKGPTKRTLNQ